MTNNTYIDKMECTPFSRQIDSVISLTFDGESTCKPHIFTCYNNEVSSSLYLHNKLILLESSQNCTRGSSDKNIELIISQLINDLNNKLAQFINKDIFYEYINNIPNPFSYIKYIKSSDILYTEKTFATSKGFIMYSTGDGGTESGGDSGTLNHDLLFNRDLVNQHPISSITGLTEALNGKALSGHYHDNYLSAINKMMVESVLTGDISTHSHSIYALLNGSPSEDFAVKDLRAKGIGYFENGVVIFGTEGGSGGSGGLDIVELSKHLTTNPENWKLALSYLPANIIYEGDGRLTNARQASDVYQWAKAVSKPSYTAGEVGALSSSGGTLTGGIIQAYGNGTNYIGRDSVGLYLTNANSVGAMTAQLLLTNDARILYYTSTTNQFYDILTSRYFDTNTYLDGSLMPLKTGFTSATGYTKNPPGVGWYNYITNSSYERDGTSWVMQIANTFGGGINPSNEIYFRQQAAANDISSAPWCRFWHDNNFNPNATTRATNQLEAFNSDNFTSGEHYVKAIRENSWRIRLWGCYNMGYGLADEVCVGYANNANFLQTPDYGRGYIQIGTNLGVLPGRPNESYPTIKTTYTYLFFAANSAYVMALGREGNSTLVSPGDSADFKFDSSIKTIGTLVMFSTT